MAGLPSPREESPAFRLARLMARYGAPGAILAFLILRATALAPFALAPLKTAKILPVVVFCCYEVTWLFGWLTGALIIAQYVLHESAHLSAARALGRAPGWYALVPIAGPYASAAGALWQSREAEALVALRGQLAGLIAAASLFAAGVLLAAPMLRQAALVGFLFNLVQLLPLRLLDGGRLFPGLDWPASPGEDMTARLRLSLAFEAYVRRIGRALGLDRPDCPKPLRLLLGPALFVTILSGFGLVVAVALLLPLAATAVAILVWIITTFGLLLLVPNLDGRVLDSGRERLLAPRRAAPTRQSTSHPAAWSSRKTARAAFTAYVLLLGAHGLGAFAAWSS